MLYHYYIIIRFKFKHEKLGFNGSAMVWYGHWPQRSSLTGALGAPLSPWPQISLIVCVVFFKWFLRPTSSRIEIDCAVGGYAQQFHVDIVPWALSHLLRLLLCSCKVRRPRRITIVFMGLDWFQGNFNRKAPWSYLENLWFPVSIFPETNPLILPWKIGISFSVIGLGKNMEVSWTRLK